MSETPLATGIIPVYKRRESTLTGVLWWLARVAAAVFSAPRYGRGELDPKFKRETDSPRGRLRSARRAQRRTTESHS